jgi:hypothetical protein
VAQNFGDRAEEQLPRQKVPGQLGKEDGMFLGFEKIERSLSAIGHVQHFEDAGGVRLRGRCTTGKKLSSRAVMLAEKAEE